MATRKERVGEAFSRGHGDIADRDRAWYERLALVLMNHYNASDQEKLEKRREATQVCIDGLLDEDTHLSE